jgi:hypothetical protein
MALYRPGDRKHPVLWIPHRILFEGWIRRLSPLELKAIEVELDRIVRVSRGGQIDTACWFPPHLSPRGCHDWEGTPLMRIWDKACQRNPDQTSWFFALLLWEHIQDRPEAWHFKMLPLNEVPLAGTQYHAVRSRERVEHFDSALASL